MPTMFPEPDVTYEGVVKVELVSTKGAPPSIGIPRVEAFEADELSQLVIVLPQSANSGYQDVVVRNSSYGIVCQEQVQDRVQASALITFNTRAWPPGRYQLFIRHRDAWLHEIALRKATLGSSVSYRSSEETYRNGRGGRSLEAGYAGYASKATVEIAGTIRSGTITYREEGLQINFRHEMGNGSCLFFVKLPRQDHWQMATGAELARRDEIVDFVAETVCRQHAPGVKYSIAQTQITYHARP